MELSELPRKLKRAKDWFDFVQAGGVQDPHLRSEVLKNLDAFKQALAKCWKAKTVGADELKAISDLERKLEQQNEEARMTTVGKHSGTPTRVV